MRPSLLLSALAQSTCSRMFDTLTPPHFINSLQHIYSSGIGGGGFMTIRIPPNSTYNTSEVWSIDFRESAPGLAHSKMYVDDPEGSKFGGLSVAVLGELRGPEEAHRWWGRLPWKKLVMPSVELASGWRVDKELARRIQVGLLKI